MQPQRFARAVVSISITGLSVLMDVVYTNYRFIEPELAFEAKECAARGDKKVLTKEYSREYYTETISFHNISYIVEQTRLCFKKRPPKVILNNVR